MAKTRKVVTLLTDFGTDDWFVGTMKGVLLGLQPKLHIIDLTHNVPPGDVRAGAFALAAAARYFPRNTIHVAVVDPGVGGPREAIAVETKDYIFVGPDNGLLSLALLGESTRRIHRLVNTRCFLPSVSRTFQGRDVFAPVAAHLSRGVSIRSLGPKQIGCQQLDWPEVRKVQGGFCGEIVYLDRFGNAICNLSNELIEPMSKAWTICWAPRGCCPVRAFYGAVPERRPVAVPGSTGFIEIAVNCGSAAAVLGLRVGTKVKLGR